MTILETHIIDVNDTKHVVSSARQSFNLLELTENNPVVLAHTSIASGVYKQIRLILDESSTITLNDGTVHPLRIPSAEQTGIKIDGIFEIPKGKLYTLDIDLIPEESVHYTPGSGYIMKPVISLTGSDPLIGNFNYAGEYNTNEFVLQLNNNGTMNAIYSEYPDYIVTGSYFHDGVNQTLTITPQDIRCPSCNSFERWKLDNFADIPSQQIFNVVSFTSESITLKQGQGGEITVVSVPTFSLANPIETIDLQLNLTSIDPQYAGKAMAAKIIPENGNGKPFFTIVDIDQNSSASLEFRIPITEFGSNSSKNYTLAMLIAESRSSFTLDTLGISDVVESDVLSHNSNGLIQLRITRNYQSGGAVDVPYVASN